MQDGVGFKIGRRGNIECHWSAGPGRCLILLFNWSQHADPASRSLSHFLISQVSSVVPSCTFSVVRSLQRKKADRDIKETQKNPITVIT